METFELLSIPKARIGLDALLTEIQSQMCTCAIQSDNCVGVRCDDCLYYYRNRDTFGRWYKKKEIEK